jgi:hypothetical protein
LRRPDNSFGRRHRAGLFGSFPAVCAKQQTDPIVHAARTSFRSLRDAPKDDTSALARPEPDRSRLQRRSCPRPLPGRNQASAGSHGLAYEYVFVDDGSRDGTAAILTRELENGLPGRLLGLSRNFGKEAALSAGLDAVQGDVAVIIDADLQDPPELILEMLDGWRAGYDVVYGLRVDRTSDTLMKRSTADMFYRLFNRLAHIEMPANAGDFRLIDRTVIDALKRLPERNRFMKGLFAWVGFPAMALPYERPPRKAGTGKFNYWKLWNFAIDGLTGFTTLPLRVWFYGGALISLAFLCLCLYLTLRVLVFGIDVPGYASLMVGAVVLLRHPAPVDRHDRRIYRPPVQRGQAAARLYPAGRDRGSARGDRQWKGKGRGRTTDAQ